MKAILDNLKEYENNYIKLEKKNIKLEETITELKNRIDKAQINFRLCQVKLDIYKQLMEKEGINITDYVEEDIDGLNIYNYSSKQINIFRKGKTGAPFKTISVSKKVSQPRQSHVSHASHVSQPVDVQQSQHVENVDFTELCTSLENSRNTIAIDSKISSKLRNVLNNLYAPDTTLDQYKTTVKSYIDRIETSLDKRTKLTVVRKRAMYSNIVPPIYSRICQFAGFMDIKLDTDDVCLYLNIINSMYKDSTDVQQLLNHSICLKTDTEYITDYLMKRKDIRYYGDEYKFYILSNGDHKWVLDNRLLSTSLMLSRTILVFALSLYRIIHADIFKDNLMRDDTVYTQYPELYQLRKTIIFISNKRKFNDFLIDFIKGQLMYVKTSTDTFNLVSDDNEKVEEYKSKQSDISRLFDLSSLYDDFTLEKLLTII
jgi:hypothetical protein